MSNNKDIVIAIILLIVLILLGGIIDNTKKRIECYQMVLNEDNIGTGCAQYFEKDLPKTSVRKGT